MTTTSTTHIDIGHTKVAHEQLGDGPDVLFVHGWPLHRETWRDVAGRLDGYTRHLIDLPGAGHSTAGPDTPLNLPGHADSLVRVLDELDLDDVVLVGHDSGGLFARMAAAERPDRVSGLILSGTEIPGHHPWQVALFTLLAKIPGGSSALKMTLGNSVLANSPLALGGCFEDTANISERFARMVGDLLEDDELLASQMEMVRSFDSEVVEALVEVHGKLTMATLLIWGENDSFFPVAKARAMVDQFAGPTTFETVAAARLFVHEERPERYGELASSFLADLGSTGSH